MKEVYASGCGYVEREIHYRLLRRGLKTKRVVNKKNEDIFTKLVKNKTR